MRSMDKLDRLFLDQQIYGFFSRLFGRYSFSTDKIGKSQFEVNFVNSDDTGNQLKKVNIFKDKVLVMSFEISEALNYKSLCFKVDEAHEFNFHYFCIGFKFFYQYIKQNTNYEHLVLCTSRYYSYIFKRLFGFAMIGWDKDNFYLDFNTKEGLQNIWEEYYGTGLEENLYNFMLPVEAGGFMPSNIKFKKPNTAATALTDFRKTEKKYLRSEQPSAQIKVGYDQHIVTVLNMSESGLAIMVHANSENPNYPDLQMNHIYSVWVNCPELNINWTSLSVQVVWQRDNIFGCRIREASPAWRQFIMMMNIKHYQRLTFTDRILA